MPPPGNCCTCFKSNMLLLCAGTPEVAPVPQGCSCCFWGSGSRMSSKGMQPRAIAAFTQGRACSLLNLPSDRMRAMLVVLLLLLLVSWSSSCIASCSISVTATSWLLCDSSLKLQRCSSRCPSAAETCDVGCMHTSGLGPPNVHTLTVPICIDNKERHRTRFGFSCTSNVFVHAKSMLPPRRLASP